jgi:hypothetical protein
MGAQSVSILITSDLSLTDNPRDEYRWQFLEHTLPALLRAERADTLYVLGDITEEKDNHGAWLVNRVSDAFYKLAQLVKDLIILRGNHDYAGSGFPFFSFLDMLSNVQFISEPKAIDGFLFLPHTTNYRRDWEVWKDSLRRFPLVFAHNTFEGAMANGVLLPGIPPEYFPPSCLIIAGDVHTPQTHKKLWYVGAPYTVDFGDDYTPRVLALHDRPFRLESIPVPGPQKRLVVLDRHGLPETKRGCNKGDILKIRVALAKQDYAQWPEIRDKVRKMATDQGFEVYAVEPIVQKLDRSDAVRRRRGNTETDEELLRRYASIHNIDPKTLKIGLELL